MDKLFTVRLTADYEYLGVSERLAKRGLVQAKDMVGGIGERMNVTSLSEPPSAYNVNVKTKTRDPMEYVEEFKARILKAYPDVDFLVRQRAEHDFTIKVYGDYEEMGFIPDVLGAAAINLLCDEDVWIVVMGLPRRPAAVEPYVHVRS